LLIWIIGYFCWIIAGFCGVEIIFGCKEVLDVGFVDSPEAFFDALGRVIVCSVDQAACPVSPALLHSAFVKSRAWM
jgi:hypothetical protein